MFINSDLACLLTAEMKFKLNGFTSCHTEVDVHMRESMRNTKTQIACSLAFLTSGNAYSVSSATPKAIASKLRIKMRENRDGIKSKETRQG